MDSEMNKLQKMIIHNLFAQPKACCPIVSLLNSKATLLVNVVTPRLIGQQLVATIDYSSHKSKDMSELNNFVKSSQRLQKIKQLLDNQVKK